MLCSFQQFDDFQQCRTCGRKTHLIGSVRAMCGGAARINRKKPTSCRHLGPELRRVGCETCGGNVQVKIFACAVFGECALAKKIDSLACCATCDKWEWEGEGAMEGAMETAADETTAAQPPMADSRPLPAGSLGPLPSPAQTSDRTLS